MIGTYDIYIYMCVCVLVVYILSTSHTYPCERNTPAGPPCSSWTPHWSSRTRRHWRQALDDDILAMPRTDDVFNKIENDFRLDYILPPKKSLAGKILIHSFEVAQKIVQKNEPLIYKIGYTHDAHTRFYNSKFGYQQEKCRWEKLLVLYAAGETVSPSFVEAALIQQFKGAKHYSQHRFCINVFFTSTYI